MVGSNLWSSKKEGESLAINLSNTLVTKGVIEIGLYSIGELLGDDPFATGITLAEHQ